METRGWMEMRVDEDRRVDELRCWDGGREDKEIGGNKGE